MKKTTRLVLLLTCFCIFTMQAQYEFSVTTESYENLENATSLNNNQLWDDPDFVIPIGFDFRLGDIEVDTIFLTEDGAGGLIFTDADTDALPLGAFGPILQDIVDRGDNTGSSLSPLSFVLEGEAGSRILKVEWNNVGFFDDSSLQDFANIQLWLYEAGNIIEYRYGPSEINNPSNSFEGLTGLQVGLFPLIPEEDEALEADSYILSGDADNPDFITLNTIEAFENAEFTAVTGMPSDGTVYRFASEALSLEEVSLLDLAVYPNPTQDIFKINAQGVDYKMDMYNLIGTQVMKSDSPKEFFDISELSSGIYLIKITTAAGQSTRRIIKS